MVSLLLPSEPESVHDRPPIELRGAVHELWATLGVHKGSLDQVIVDGPRGCGKTTGLAAIFASMSEVWPNSRGIICRRYKKDLPEVLSQTWEAVLGGGHPAIDGRSTVEYRKHYQWPTWPDGRPGARVVLCGLDDPGGLLSTQYDWGWVIQGEQVSREQWGALGSCMRHGAMPMQVLVGDVNPSYPGHWINRMAGPGKAMRRLIARFVDNPRAYERGADGALRQTEWGASYLATLRSTCSPTQFKRWVLGLWEAEAGLVLDCYDAPVHARAPIPDPKTVHRYVGTVDWGLRGISCAQVWAHVVDPVAPRDAKGRPRVLRYRVAEVYGRAKGLAWIVQKLVELYDEFPMQRVLGDSEDLSAIEVANGALRRVRDAARPEGEPVPKGASPIVVPCNKTVSWPAGVELMRQGLRDGRTYLCEGALRERDEALAAEGYPCCTEEEVERLTFADIDPARPVDPDYREKPHPGQANHGFDAWRYHEVDCASQRDQPIVEPPRFKRAPDSHVLVPSLDKNTGEMLWTMTRKVDEGDEWEDADGR